MTTAATATKVFADRIGRIEVSATMAVTAEAAKLRAQGAKLVDFGAGEPHFATPRSTVRTNTSASCALTTSRRAVAASAAGRKSPASRYPCP